MSSIDNSELMEDIKSKSKSISLDTLNTTQDTNVDFLEKLDDYYILKNKYDTNIKEKKNSILHDDNISMKQKREKYNKLKFRCINCSRNVNTIFEINDGILSAVCGDKSSPCNLNIKINRGKYIDIRTLIDVFQEGVDNVKDEIISTKLDLLFGYSDESTTITKFNELKKELTSDLEALAEYKTQFIDIIYNLKNKDSLKSKMEQFYRNVSTIKDTMKEFNETGIINLVKDVVSLYQNELKPLLIDINRLQYRKKAIESDDKKQTFHLKRDTYTLSNIQVPFSSPSVESFEIGTSSTTKKEINDSDDESVDNSEIQQTILTRDDDIVEKDEVVDNNKVTIKDGKIFLGNNQILDKNDFESNMEIYSNATEVTAGKAHELKYIMEMIHVGDNRPELIAIDTANGDIYKVLVGQAGGGIETDETLLDLE